MAGRMEMSYAAVSCGEYLRMLSSKAPVPGGGGASAFAGALAASLSGMVANLTIGKKKYREYEAEMTALREESEALTKELLLLVDEDAEAFSQAAAVFRMPRDTEDERAEREKMMEPALRRASEIPLRIMEKACRVVELTQVCSQKGSALAVSDSGCAASLALAALQSASLGVYGNTALMKDRSCAEAMDARAKAMLDEYAPMAQKTYEDVRSRLM